MAEFRKNWADVGGPEGKESDSEGEDQQSTEESQKEELRRSFYRSFDDNGKVGKLAFVVNCVQSAKCFPNFIFFLPSLFFFFKKKKKSVKVLRPSQNQLIQEQQTQSQEQAKNSNSAISRGSNRNLSKSNDDTVTVISNGSSDSSKMDSLRHYLKSNYQTTLQEQREGTLRGIDNVIENEEQSDTYPISVGTSCVTPFQVQSLSQVPSQPQPPPSSSSSSLLVQDNKRCQLGSTSTAGALSTRPMEATSDTTRMTKSLPDLFRHAPLPLPSLSRQKTASPQSVSSNSNLPLHEIQNPKILEYIQQLEAYIQYQNQQTAQLTAQLNLTNGHVPYTGFPVSSFQ
ncbi:hypothetical protein RFI_16324, partial [Reticulomyxa filosa]